MAVPARNPGGIPISGGARGSIRLDRCVFWYGCAARMWDADSRRLLRDPQFSQVGRAEGVEGVLYEKGNGLILEL
jgi:hypothetical protein